MEFKIVNDVVIIEWGGYILVIDILVKYYIF